MQMVVVFDVLRDGDGEQGLGIGSLALLIAFFLLFMAVSSWIAKRCRESRSAAYVDYIGTRSRYAAWLTRHPIILCLMGFFLLAPVASGILAYVRDSRDLRTGNYAQVSGVVTALQQQVTSGSRVWKARVDFVVKGIPFYVTCTRYHGRLEDPDDSPCLLVKDGDRVQVKFKPPSQHMNARLLTLSVAEDQIDQ